MKRTLTLLLAAALIVCMFTGCTSLDYRSAEELESALNRGTDVTGKTAKIKVREVKAGLLNLYFSGWAGEHLNLISETRPDFEAEDAVIIRISEVSNLMGSWLINYELIK